MMIPIMTKQILPITCAWLLAVAGFAGAADSNAALIGTISDTSGSRVTGAIVTVTSMATNVAYVAVSNDTGLYRVAGLPPGRYRAHVEKDGFKRVERADIDLHVQDEASLNVQLQVGPVSEAVTVAAIRPLINVTSGSVGTVVDREFVANMPLNGRSFQSLIALTPGVVVTAATSAAQGQFSVNGQRADANYFMVDGVSANVGISPSGAQNSSGTGSGIQTNAFGAYSNFVSVDAMQEFRIETSSFAPEYGRLPGGQISIVTRSGSNAFHGDVFEYYRDTKFDANNWFNNASGAPRPPDRSDDFGGVVGGPMLKNRVFFFASHEGQRLQVPQTVTANVPSLAARQNAVATMRPFLNAYPLPTQPQCQTGTANCDPNVASFIGAYANDSSMDATSIRVDGRPTSSMTIFGRVNHAPSHGSIRSTQPSVVADLTLNLDTVTAGQTWVLGSTTSNDLRFNYSHTPSYNTNRLDAFGGAVPLPDSAMFLSPYDATSSTWTFSGRTIGAIAAGSAAYDQSSQFNVVDSFSWLRGEHQMKFGVDFRRMYPRADRSAYGQTLAATLTTASWVHGTLSQYATSAFSAKDFTYYNLGAYAQDAWHATPRLTLTYGLRWDVNPAPGSPTGLLPAFADVDLSNLAATKLAPDGTPAYETQWNAFAPRVGFAYQLSDDERWGRVLRAGSGLFFDTGGAATGFSERSFTSALFPNPSFPIPASLTVRPTIPTSPPWGFITTANPHLRMPYTYQANVALEQAVGLRQSLTVTYAGAWGRNLLRRDTYIAPNADLPQGFYAIGNESYSNYNSLQLQFQRRLSHGFQAMAAYTLAKSMDTGSNQSGTIAPNVTLEPVTDYYGPSDFDIRHSFQTALTYQIPTLRSNRVVETILGNWSIDGIFHARSAPPIDLVQTNAYLAAAKPFLPGTTTNNTAGMKFAVRPSLVPGVDPWIDDPKAPGGRRLNLAAFVVLPANSVVAGQGSLARNELRGFGWAQADMTVRRDVPIQGAVRLQLRVDFFNITNTPAFWIGTSALDVSNPLFGAAATTLNNSLGSGGAQGGYSPLYQIGGPRTIQFSAKLLF
jgi:hypothetical protein